MVSSITTPILHTHVIGGYCINWDHHFSQETDEFPRGIWEGHLSDEVPSKHPSWDFILFRWSADQQPKAHIHTLYKFIICLCVPNPYTRWWGFVQKIKNKSFSVSETNNFYKLKNLCFHHHLVTAVAWCAFPRRTISSTKYLPNPTGFAMRKWSLVRK